MSRTCLAYAGLFAVSVLTYVNCIQNEFVFDGLYLIKSNPWITDISHTGEIFSSSSWSFIPGLASGTYRPAQLLMYMGIYSLFGQEPAGYHLFSILFHSLNTLWIFYIFSCLLQKPEGKTGLKRAECIAFISALLFAVHPVHTENVTWATGMVDPASTFFLLTCFFFYMGGTEKPAKEGSVWLTVSWLLFFTSLFLKEIALTFPAMLISYDYYRKRFLLHWSRLVIYSLFAAAGIVYLYIRYLVIGVELGEKLSYDLTFFQTIFNVFPLLALYLGKFLVPLGLNAFYGIEPLYSPWNFKLFFSTISIFVLGVWYTVSFFKDRLVFFLLTWTLVPLIPVLYIPALGRSIFADRYMYLPGVALLVLVVMAGFNLYDRLDFAKKRELSILGLILLVSVYGVLTIQRNRVWKNEYTLWSDTVKKSPNSYLPLRKMGDISFERGEWEKSLEYLGRAVAVQLKVMPLDPTLKEIYVTRGLAYLKLKKEAKAISEFKTSLKVSQGDPVSRFFLGVGYANLGQLENAVTEFRIALRIRPGFKKAREELDRLLEIKKQREAMP